MLSGQIIQIGLNEKSRSEELENQRNTSETDLFYFAQFNV